MNSSRCPRWTESPHVRYWRRGRAVGAGIKSHVQGGRRVDGGGVVAGTAQVGELSEELPAREAVVVDHQVGVDFAVARRKHGFGRRDDGGRSRRLLGSRVPCSCSVLMVSLDATFGHGLPFSSEISPR